MYIFKVFLSFIYIKMKETEVDSKKSTLEVTKALVQGSIARKSLTCYTPDTWSTAIQNNVSNFVTISGGTTAATIPAGARIVTVKLTVPTAVANDGSSTYDIGLHTTSETTNDGLYDGITKSAISATTKIVWGGFGFSTIDADGLPGLSAVHYVTIKTLDGGPNTLGKLRLDILYEV